MAELSARRRWALLTTVAAGLLLVTLDNSILYTALPTLTAEIGATSSQSLWIINAYPVVMAGLLLGSGTLGDRVGHRRMFLIGLVVFGLASAAAAFSPSPELLIAARAVLAVGAAAMMPATLALIRVTFLVERERNVAIGVWGSIAVVGAALGPIVGGLLLEHFWWGSVFLINVPVVIVALVATLVLAPANDPDPSKKWDLVSSVLAMITLVGAVFFIKEITHVPQNWAIVVGGVAAAVVGGILFVRRQRRMTDPTLDFAVFRNPAFSSGVLAAAVAMFTIGGSQLVLTQRYQLVDGFTPLEAGLLVAMVAVGTLPTAILGGAFLHRVGLLALIAGGLAVATGGAVVAIVGVQAGLLAVVIIGLVVTGAGLGAAMSVASSVIVGNVPARRAGMAAAVEEVSYEFGSLIAVALLGSLLTFVYTATVTLPEGASEAARESISSALATADGNAALIAAAQSAYGNGFLLTMIVLAGVLAVGTATAAVLLRKHRPGTPSQTYSNSH